MPSFPMECICERCRKIMPDHPAAQAELEYCSDYQRRALMTDRRVRCFCKPGDGRQADMFEKER